MRVLSLAPLEIMRCRMHDVQSTFPVGSFIRGQFVVLELLSRGASGAVYLVSDKRNDYNRFVIKEVVSAVRKKRHGSPFDAATLSRLNHAALPHIYQVFHSDKQDRCWGKAIRRQSLGGLLQS